MKTFNASLFNVCCFLILMLINKNNCEDVNLGENLRILKILMFSFAMISTYTCVIVIRVFTIKPQMVENAYRGLVLENKNVQNCYICGFIQ